MTASLDRFKGYLNKFSDFAKSDRYLVYITPPPALSKYVSSTEGLSLQCEAAEIPGRTLSTFQARTAGPSLNYPYQSTYQEMNLTFLCMANRPGQKHTGLWEKSFFDDWLDLIDHSPKMMTATTGLERNGWNIGYRKDYQGIVQVKHYDVRDNENYVVCYYNAFPISVPSIALSWADDSPLKMPVTFTYSYWKRISNPSQAAPANRSDDSLPISIPSDPGSNQQKVQSQEDIYRFVG